MSAKNKRVGALFETDVLKWFRARGSDVTRLSKVGKLDESDIEWRNGGLVFLYELKNVRQINHTDFIKQAEKQAANYEKARGLEEGSVRWAFVLKKRNATIGDAFVVTSLTEHVRQVENPF